MSPKVAGWFGMPAAAVIAAAAGFLIANSATSILGALVLVGATILFSIAAVWTLRKTWADKAWPPGVPASASRRRRRQRIGAIVQCVLSPLLIALSVLLIVAGSTWAVVYILLGVINGGTALWTLKLLRDSASKSK
ncbi:hypothetical protein [Cryobacterium serini]|uniref:Uncharacterized protein n=1 Tax=Cryobacterium serini TaxID=1259201 RepID=A0A4R9BKW6_9MICO|nr:hypothetical protein [Cryobacterium serini]TFD86624.1 hypothetical protein E3T51_11800 [Cryobacterium serini]